MLTESQLEDRLNFVTGSDAAVICGMSPWGNKVELWKQKRRITQAQDIGDKPAVRAGNYLEPVVIQWFMDDTGKSVETDDNLIIHPTIPYMAANIDGRVVADNAVFEAKTAGYSKGWGTKDEQMIPDHYLCQVAHYMAVEDAERAFVAVLISGSDFRWYTIERDMRLEKIILEQEAEFWRQVQTGTPPNPASADEVFSLYGANTDTDPAVADLEIERRIFELGKAKEAVKEAKEKQEELENAIKLYMGKHDTLISKDGIILSTWKAAKPTQRFDATLFKKENKETYTKYIKQSEPQRRFLLK